MSKDKQEKGKFNYFMKKEDIIKIIHNAAKQYKINLLNRKVVFAYIKNNQYEFIETVNKKVNFLHLTGVGIAKNKNKQDKFSKKTFYELAVSNRLSHHDIEIRNSGEVRLKMDVIERLMSIHKIAKMVGEFEEYRPRIIIDEVIGTQQATMGYIKDQKNMVFAPSSTLKEDIRNLSKKVYGIVGVLVFENGKLVEERFKNEILKEKIIDVYNEYKKIQKQKKC